jgi:hypothetical protein
MRPEIVEGALPGNETGKVYSYYGPFFRIDNQAGTMDKYVSTDHGYYLDQG